MDPTDPNSMAFTWLWGLAIVPFAAGALLIARRSRTLGAEERERLLRLRKQQDRLLEAALRLEADAEGARPPADQPVGRAFARAHADLDRRVVELLTEARALGEELTVATAALDHGLAAESEPVLADVERRLPPLEAELTAAIAAMAAIADGQGEIRARGAAARLRVDALRGRAVGQDGLAMLGDRLADADRRAGLDPEGALDAVQGVERALDRLETRTLSRKPGGVSMLPDDVARD